MSMLNIGKKLDSLSKVKHECKHDCKHKHELTEAKADNQRLIDFAGQELADRFLAIKDKLKAPENDLYYWIKNKTTDELEQVITEIEDKAASKKAVQNKADQGATLVCDTAHWKVYHITTFEASQKYGRDSRWCITGVNDYGDKYWKDYTGRGIKFYFAIAKQNYDPRGEDSKFALAVYPDNSLIELYNQVDDRANIDDMPYWEELDIPGVDLGDVLDPADEASNGIWCEECDADITDDYNISPDGEYLCNNCFYNTCRHCSECGDAFYTADMIQSVYGDFYCETCWSEEYIGSDESWADTFVAMAEAISPGEIAELAEDNDLEHMLGVWANAKAKNILELDDDRITELEQAFIKYAAEDGINITPEMLEVSTALKPIAENSQWGVYKPTNLKEGRQIAKNNGWDDESIDYADLQCWNDEEIYKYGKTYLILAKNGRPRSYSGNDVGAYFLIIRPDGSFDLQEDDALWCDKYPSIRGAEDLNIEGFKFPTPDEDGMFYTQEGEHRVLRGCTYAVATGLKTYTIKEGTTKIGYEALTDAGNLETLVIPESVKVIAESGIPQDDNFTDYKVVCKKGSYAETYCRENNIPVQLSEQLVLENVVIEASDSLASEYEEYDTMWDKVPLQELKKYTPPTENPNKNTQVDFRDCRSAFDCLAREIARTLPSTKSFSRFKITESTLWLKWTLQNLEEFVLVVQSQDETKPRTVSQPEIEKWTCAYKKLGTPSNQMGTWLINTTQAFNSYEEILAELKKQGIINDPSKCIPLTV